MSSAWRLTSRRVVTPGRVDRRLAGTSSWLNQIEIWFGRQAIRRGTFTSVRVLIKQINDYITTWNTNPRPFTWMATVDEILAKVKVVEANVRKLVDNNAR